MSEPVKDKNKMLAVRMSASMKKKLEAHAEKSGQTKSEVVRLALASYLRSRS